MPAAAWPGDEHPMTVVAGVDVGNATTEVAVLAGGRLLGAGDGDVLVDLAASGAGPAGAEGETAGADRDDAAGQPARRQPKSTTRRSRHPRRR